MAANKTATANLENILLFIKLFLSDLSKRVIIVIFGRPTCRQAGRCSFDKANGVPAEIELN